jgi:hypothetical protein
VKTRRRRDVIDYRHQPHTADVRAHWRCTGDAVLQARRVNCFLNVPTIVETWLPATPFKNDDA